MTRNLRAVIALTATLLVACTSKQEVEPASTPAQEPTSNLNLDLTEVNLNRDTIPAGETASLQIVTKNASGAKASFKNVRLELGLKGGSSLGTFGDISANADGTFTVDFTARRAGTPAEIEVKINGETPKSAAPKVTVVPGTVSLEQSAVSVQQPQVRAGEKTRVVLRAMDTLGNQLASGGLEISFGLNGGGSKGDFGTVTDHQDGTYSAMFTAVTAGGPSPVFARIAGQTIKSPLPAVTVLPGDFSPAQTQVTATAATVRSSETIEVTITARDANGNRLTEGGQTFQLTLAGGTSTGSFGPIRDLGNGTYASTFTGWIAGTAAKMTATFNDKPVGASFDVTVTAGKHDVSRSTIACASSKITLGGSLICTLILKDPFDNVTTTTTVPVFRLRDGTSEGAFAPATSTGQGGYTSVFKATKDGTPARVEALLNDAPATSSSPTLEVIFPSLTHSTLTVDNAKVASGSSTFLRFQARDASGNEIDAEGLTIAFAAGMSQGSTVEIAGAQDRGNGLYVASVTGLRAGNPVELTAVVGGRSFEGQKPSITVVAGDLTQISIENANDGNGQAIGAQTIETGGRLKAYLIGRDNSGNFIAALKASNWSLNDARYGTLSESSGATTELIANRAATGDDGVKFRATYAGPPVLNAESGAVKTAPALPATIGDLARWYRAESFMHDLSTGSVVGDPKETPWYDAGASEKPYNGNESSPQRRPRYFAAGMKKKPSVLFCNTGGSCPDSISDRIRIDSSLDAFPVSEQDFTVIVVAARDHSGANHLLAANDNHKGLFLGWTDKDELKLGVNGSSGNHAIAVEVQDFKKPEWQIITGSLDRGDGSGRPGLSLFVNGKIVAQDAQAHKPPSKGAAAPYIGMTTSRVHIGDVLIYKRALKDDERCKLHEHLNEKYELGLQDICNVGTVPEGDSEDHDRGQGNDGKDNSNNRKTESRSGKKT